MLDDRPFLRRLVATTAAVGAVASLAVAVQLGLSSADKRHPNLLDNSGFGHGLDGWDVPRRGSLDLKAVTPGVRDSRYALRLVAEHRRDVRVHDRASQFPATDKGQRYRASAFVRVPRGDVDGRIRVREYDGNRVMGQRGTPLPAAQSGWDRIAVGYTAKAAGTRLQVSVIFPGLRADEPVLLDRVRLRAVGGGDAPRTGGSAGGTTSQTLFGASVYQDGLSWESALKRSHERYGGLEVVRVFHTGLPSPWPGRAGAVGGPVVVSFKAPPSQILSGQHDRLLRSWFNNAPTDREIWWSYFHEPEDDVERGSFTAAQWRAAFQRIAGFADSAGNPRLHNTVILMCWTVNPGSGRDFSDFFPGRDAVETIGWDCYNKAITSSQYADPKSMYTNAIATSRRVGVGWGIAETGSKKASGDSTGSRRAAWLRDVGAFLSREGAEFVTYFDSIVGGEFRLLDEPSRQAWRDVVSG
jgi:hypothetical protein